MARSVARCYNPRTVGNPSRPRRTAVLCILAAVLGAAHASAQENWTAVAPLQLYKPDYFLMGQPDTKIQFSFKFRLLEDYNLYFGYTQLMNWQLVRSDPYFADINYNPEFFYRFNINGSSTTWADFGPFEHESNGKGGAEERSWNRTYARIHDEWAVGERAVLRAELKAWIPYSSTRRTATSPTTGDSTRRTSSSPISWAASSTSTI